LQLLVVDTLDGWPESTLRDVGSYILPRQNTTVVYPRVMKRFRNLDVLMIVSSDPGRPDRREAIRKTWGLEQVIKSLSGFFLI
jgi:hypothetical protein